MLYLYLYVFHARQVYFVKKISRYKIHLFQQQYSKNTTSTKAKTQRHLKLNVFHSSIYLHLHISHRDNNDVSYTVYLKKFTDKGNKCVNINRGIKTAQ